jgi:hypothetical protein
VPRDHVEEVVVDLLDLRDVVARPGTSALVQAAPSKWNERPYGLPGSSVRRALASTQTSAAPSPRMTFTVTFS